MAYIIIIVDITDIIAITNINTSIMKLLVKKVLLANSVSNSSIYAFLSNQKFLYHIYTGQYILLSVSGVDNNISSNVLLFRKTGKVTSEVNLLVSMRLSNSSVKVKFISIASKCTINGKIHY